MTHAGLETMRTYLWICERVEERAPGREDYRLQIDLAVEDVVLRTLDPAQPPPVVFRTRAVKVSPSENTAASSEAV